MQGHFFVDLKLLDLTACVCIASASGSCKEKGW